MACCARLRAAKKRGRMRVGTRSSTQVFQAGPAAMPKPQ